ncbi:MAG: hypothetical protein HN981_03205 [Candidatus Pacebacteria bacterium]|jgi:hypothetical protein|nr:hypothetical protein [Candidatus Paceibacterota bacterium]MBT4652116.1 hypothetical protein [Candidatus Paceibacterota bacterium]MBT6756547.1 hypothetical protein [Candidatus Paceibacterota bacterium]MBT6921372.1 hypothetical protein [Candidatus Paceibacterota bacterium]
MERYKGLYFTADKGAGSGSSSSKDTSSSTSEPEKTVPERMDEAVENAGLRAVTEVIKIANEQLGK